jgi:WD40 repeat protein
VGRFRIRTRLGAGSFGVVYLAYDPQLDRDVALKMPLPGTLDDPQRVERFLREARAAAQLRHPHIVPVYEAGGQPPDCYIASQFIPGRPLAAALAEGPLDCGQAARVVRELAEALAYAHGLGIVHRDVKPANVMLDGQGRAHLMDFGLAHRRDSGDKLTQEGALLGTPAYMAPEQVAGPAPSAAPAGDQYSLGVVLYELLCGQTPFDGPPEVVLFNAVHTEPPPPRRVKPQVPRDLETVCLKALAKEPARRYADCQALADDLRRWLEGEPIRARRLGLLERGRRWCRRNPAVAALTAAVATTLVLGTVVASYFAVQAWAAKVKAEESEQQAVKQRRRALEQLERAESLVYAGQIALAQREWLDGNVGHARELLRACRRDFRGWEHRYLVSTLVNQDQSQRALRGHTGAVHGVAFSPGGQRLASSGGDKTVKLWDPQTGQEILTLKGHTGAVSSVAFSPDGMRLASASEDGTVKVWDAQTGQETLSLQGHTGAVSSVAFSPDGKRLASASMDVRNPGKPGEVKVWDAATGQETLSLQGHTGWVYSVAFSPDGKRLASGSGGIKNPGKNYGELKLWDLTTGQEVLAFQGHGWLVTSLAFSPDGKRLASASWDTSVMVWDAQTGQGTTLLGHTGWVYSVAFSPDGTRLASVGGDRFHSNHTQLKVWDVANGHEILTLQGYTGDLSSVAFSPDGMRLASGGADGTVKMWVAQAGQEP